MPVQTPLGLFMKPLFTLAEAYRYVENNHDKETALAFQSKDLTSWIGKSTKEVLLEIRYLTLGLYKLGIRKGEIVGILANSSPRWTIADFAIILCGGVTVPLFANISDENFTFEVRQTQMKTIFVHGKEQWEMFEKHKSEFEKAISLNDEYTHHITFSFTEILQQGQALDEKKPELFDQLLDQVKSEDLASIVYTSGSTGTPKGVMLTHKNMTSLIHIDPFKWDKANDLYLSVLPLAHIFGRTLNLAFFCWGIPIYYIRDIQTVGQVCKELHPTILIVVPRLLEKIYAKMLAKAQAAGFVKSAIANWAFELANDENDSSFYKQLLHPVADALVYSSLREALGGKVRVVVSGGAALNPHLYHFFLNIGVPLYEGWGMTEAAVIGVNLPGNTKIGTVGPCVDTVQVKLSENGEILVKGDVVTKGYYKNEEATKEAIDKEGWFHTGDKGEIDEDGFVTIIGRLKELYKLSTGKFIAPVQIEQELCRAPLIDMAMVIADKRTYPVAVLFPDFEILHALKQVHGNKEMSDQEFLDSPFIREEMESMLKKMNERLASWEQIHHWAFIPNHPTIEGGELTPTMKIRREVIMEKYKEIIEKLYLTEGQHA
jgi:long-chain acyl-CoA synthetase